MKRRDLLRLALGLALAALLSAGEASAQSKKTPFLVFTTPEEGETVPTAHTVVVGRVQPSNASRESQMEWEM